MTRTELTADMQWQKSDSLIHPLGLPTAHNSNGQKFPDLGCPLFVRFVDHLHYFGTPCTDLLGNEALEMFFLPLYTL